MRELIINMSPNNKAQNKQNKLSSQDNAKKKTNNDRILTQGNNATELQKHCVPTLFLEIFPLNLCQKKEVLLNLFRFSMNTGPELGF